jgi:hypothetical protein
MPDSAVPNQQSTNQQPAAANQQSNHQHSAAANQQSNHQFIAANQQPVAAKPLPATAEAGLSRSVKQANNMKNSSLPP